MAKNANPVIHELAVLLASKKGVPAGKGNRLSEYDVQLFYRNYLVAVKKLTELDSDEEFKKNPVVPSTHGETVVTDLR